MQEGAGSPKAGSLQKLHKTRKWIRPESLQKERSPTNTLIVAHCDALKPSDL